MPKIDVLILGAGHNGLVASILLAREGLAVTVLEERPIVGGACVTEYPFKSAPKLGCSTGAYLLGLMPPELIEKLNLDLPLIRRDPHYFLPTTSERYLLFGSDAAELRRQFIDFFSESDWLANQAMNAELGQIRDDLAPAWLMPPLTLDETAERFIRKPLPNVSESLSRLGAGLSGTVRLSLGFAESDVRGDRRFFRVARRLPHSRHRDEPAGPQHVPAARQRWNLDGCSRRNGNGHPASGEARDRRRRADPHRRKGHLDRNPRRRI